MSIDVLKIYEQLGVNPDDLETNDLSFAVGNLKVPDFNDETLLIALDEKFPAHVDSEIYHFKYGNYFITDKGYIFSKRYVFNVEEKETCPDEQINLLTAGMSAIQRAIFLKNMKPDEENRITEEYYIFKRSSKDKYLRIYISSKFINTFERNGYKVTRGKSFKAYRNIVTGKLEHFDTYSIRVQKDVFFSMCVDGCIIPRGYKKENGTQIEIKRGRPIKNIILCSGDGTHLTFAGYDECAAHFGISLSTVKRAFKNKNKGDSIRLKKQNFTLL